MSRPLLATLAAALLSAPAHALNIMVSFQPYESVVRNVAGPGHTVNVLLPPGASPHTFDPTPRAVQRLAAADIAFMNGMGLDEWMERTVRAVGSRARVVRLAERVQFTPQPVHPSHGSGRDPHVWLDASIVARMALVVGEELARLDPAGAAGYRSRAQNEGRMLMALHEELRRTLEPVRGENIVTFHGAFAYWSAAYGPRIAAVVEPFPGREPSARYVAEVVSTIRRSGVRWVYAEPSLPQGPAQTIAESAGVNLAVLAPEGSANIRDYPALMRANRDVLLRTLGR